MELYADIDDRVHLPRLRTSYCDIKTSVVFYLALVKIEEVVCVMCATEAAMLLDMRDFSKLDPDLHKILNTFLPPSPRTHAAHPHLHFPPSLFSFFVLY